MERYICLNCNYHFRAENKETCPYCGKKTVEKEKSASELIGEINIEE